MTGLLDYLKTEYKLGSDRALAEFLDVAPPAVSKWRHGHLPFSANMILRVHELTGLPVKQIKEMLR